MTGLCALLLTIQTLGSVQEGFRRAEVLYEEGNYAEAVEIYEELRRQGVESGVLHYNLGNAYIKQGELGKAILSYERARRSMPGDEDTRANLDYAYGLVAEAPEELSLPAYLAWAVNVYQSLAPDTLAIAVSLGFLAGGVATSVLLVGGAPRARWIAVYTLVLAAGLALVAGGALAGKLYTKSHRTDAIVVAARTDVRSGPGDSQPQLVEVHEGLKVRVLGSREEWLQVSLPNGVTGWIRIADVEVI